MNFSQLHERLRAELLRRIEKGTLTRASIARLAGVSQPHISNFLNGKTRLSLETCDRILTALHLSVEQLFRPRAEPAPADPAYTEFPLFNADELADADFLVSRGLPLTLPLDRYVPTTPLVKRQARQRFAALFLDLVHTDPMHPVLLPGDIVLVDRHAIVVARAEPAPPGAHMPVYAVQPARGITLFRHVVPEPARGLFLLQPGNGRFPAQTVPLARPDSANSPILARVLGVIRLQQFQLL